MALKPGTVKNFHQLGRAFQAGHIALLECTDRKTKRKVALICAINSANGQLVPYAVMCEVNPYKRYAPPNKKCTTCKKEQEKDKRDLN